MTGAAEMVELDGGQFSLAVDVVERNGQGAFAELAKAPEPAPLNHVPERPAAELAEAREEMGRLYEPGQRVTLQTSAKPSKRVYRCGSCGRKLKADHYVYSRHTGARYCWPGEGCQKPGRH